MKTPGRQTSSFLAACLLPVCDTIILSGRDKIKLSLKHSAQNTPRIKHVRKKHEAHLPKKFVYKKQDDMN
jgi:hypothetical protein